MEYYLTHKGKRSLLHTTMKTNLEDIKLNKPVTKKLIDLTYKNYLKQLDS